MMTNGYEALYRLETSGEALEATIEYVAGKLGTFLQKQEPVLICFPDQEAKSLGTIFRRAVERCGASPIMWGPDYRWKALLRLAFDTHAHTVIAHPLVVLGLMKLVRATSTPLDVHNVVLGGYPYARWMVEGIKKGLDCRIWGCYAIRSGPVVTGFTCEQEAGIHIREDIVEVQILDENGDRVLEPRRGKMLFRSQKDPEVVYDPEESAMVHYQPCSCGNDEARIVETRYMGHANATKSMMEEQFLAWSSVLDYRAEYTEHGISLELVVFPGESLPKLPSCAKLMVRPWRPQEDIPFYMRDNFVKIPEIYW